MYSYVLITKNIIKWYQKPITKNALFADKPQAWLTDYSSAVMIKKEKPMNYTGSLASFMLVNNLKI